MGRGAPARAAGAAGAGGAGGAVAVLRGVTVARGARDVLAGADLRVRRGERLGVVGANGCGKSTLLSTLVGETAPDAGTVATSFGAGGPGYFRQQGVGRLQATVLEEVTRAGAAEIRSLEAAAREAEARAEAGGAGAEDLGAVARAYERLEAAGAGDLEARTSRVLRGLGFAPEDQVRPCADFSGGWRVRIALASLLLRQPETLLLDEPSNHLDARARDWLAGYLAEYAGTVVLVSHDQELLDAVCTHVVEVHQGDLLGFQGNYSEFVAKRDAWAEGQTRAARRQQRERKRMEGFVTKFGAKATKAAQAKSIQKALDRMELVEAPETRRGRRSSLKLPPALPCETEHLIALEAAAVGYAPGAPPVLSGCDLVVEKRMKMVVLGPNGAGKSSLLKGLAGSLPLAAGRRDVSPGLKIGIFTQDLAQDLPGDRTGLDFVLSQARTVNPRLTDEAARSVLGAVGLSGPSAADTPIGCLSGGEKARVALACFALQPAACLLLDEPSNHLDFETVDTLCKALREYDGSVVTVTHNRRFAEALEPTHTAIIEEGVVVVHARPPLESEYEYSGLAAAPAREAAPSGEQPQGGGAGAAPVAATPDRKAARKAQNRMQSIMRLLDESAEELQAVDIELVAAGADAERSREIAVSRKAIEERVEALEREWEELEAVVG